MPDLKPGIDYPACATVNGNRVHCPKFGWTLTVNVWPFRCQCPDTTVPTVKAKPKCPKGPGDYLHAMITRWTGEDIRPTCNCRSWIARMNAWGPDGCREHLDEIVGHMLSEAKKRGWKLAGLPGAATVARLAVRRACRLAEKEKARHAD